MVLLHQPKPPSVPGQLLALRVHAASATAGVDALQEVALGHGAPVVFSSSHLPPQCHHLEGPSGMAQRLPQPPQVEASSVG